MHRPLGPKATKTPPPSDKVTHQGTTAAKACCVGTDPSQKVGKRQGSSQKGSYLFSKAKANQNRSQKQPHLVFNLQSPANPPEVNISMADLSQHQENLKKQGARGE
jgi:hypothetical protein